MIGKLPRFLDLLLFGGRGCTDRSGNFAEKRSDLAIDQFFAGTGDSELCHRHLGGKADIATAFASKGKAENKRHH